MNEFFVGIALPAKILIWVYAIITPVTMVLGAIVRIMK